MIDYRKLPLLLPTAYLPPVGYFVWLMENPVAIIEINETYPKQTLRNHCRIATANGIQKLSTMVYKPFGNTTKTKEIILRNDLNWQRIHWRAIITAYNKSAFFEYYMHHFDAIFKNPPDLLYQLNSEILKVLTGILSFPCQFSYTDDWKRNPKEMIDLRNFDFEVPYYSFGNFAEYIQVFSDRNPFIPNMSILDLIFNLGPSAAVYLKKQAKIFNL